MDRDLERRERRHIRRWGSRIAIGALVGAGLGAVGGAIWGAIAFRPGSTAMWSVAIGTAIFLCLIGGFVGGMSGLESPDPHMEPSQFDEPTQEPEGLTRPERPSGDAPPPR
jgi:hypothetical protein